MTTEGGLKLGALLWNQYTDWLAMRDAAVRADELGYDSLWTWDHLYPIVGSSEGPILEGWLTLAAWAEATSHAKLGLMVGANPFRNPALVAKMATTLDHISAGRAILGIGAAWFGEEHEAYGFEFGASPGERLRWLEEAAPIMRGMLRGERPSGQSRYATREVRNEPAPIQAHMPLLIGGGGERKTLRIVAQYADACNVGGGFENVKHKDEVLRRHCEEIGRDEVGDRAHGGRRDLHHPRLPGGGGARGRGDICGQRWRGALAQPAGWDAGARRGDPAPLPRDRLPAPDRGLPAPVRRGVAGAADQRGQTDGGGGLTRPSSQLRMPRALEALRARPARASSVGDGRTATSTPLARPW